MTKASPFNGFTREAATFLGKLAPSMLAIDPAFDVRLCGEIQNLRLVLRQSGSGQGIEIRFLGGSAFLSFSYGTPHDTTRAMTIWPGS